MHVSNQVRNQLAAEAVMNGLKEFFFTIVV